jgi:hypothetical protein
MKTNKILNTIAITGLLIAAVEVGYLVYKEKTKPPVVKNSDIATTTPSIMSQFNGAAVSSTEEAVPLVLAVMIDNHPDARPEAGLSQASVVYEAPVEGGITRYMALFKATDTVAKVGPVRSARPYFLDWASEYGNAPYWHCGGSPAALSLLKEYKMWDVDQFFYDRYFWRSEAKVAPHNLYTDSDNWQKLIAGSTKEAKSWKGWVFNSDIPTATSSDVLQIQIKFDTYYGIGWNFDKESGYYVRSLNGKEQADEAGQAILADNVIVQEVDTEVIDEEGRREVTTVGQGAARVLRDGKMIRGYWTKEKRTSRTRFFTNDGKEISLKPGKIWIEVVPQGSAMEVSS